MGTPSGALRNDQYEFTVFPSAPGDRRPNVTFWMGRGFAKSSALPGVRYALHRSHLASGRTARVKPEAGRWEGWEPTVRRAVAHGGKRRSPLSRSPCISDVTRRRGTRRRGAKDTRIHAHHLRHCGPSTAPHPRFVTGASTLK